MNYSQEKLREQKQRAIREAESMNRKNSREQSSPSSPPFLGGILSSFDNDTILIFLLVMLLMREKADKEIILALLYILI